MKERVCFLSPHSSRFHFEAAWAEASTSVWASFKLVCGKSA